MEDNTLGFIILLFITIILLQALLSQQYDVSSYNGFYDSVCNNINNGLFRGEIIKI